MPDIQRSWFVDQSPGRGVSVIAGSDVDTLPGKFYAEFQLVAFQAALEYWACVGFCGSTFDLTNPIVIDNATPQGANGVIFSFGNGNMLGWADPTRPEAGGSATHAVGDWIGIAIDTISHLSWVRNSTQAPTLWYGTSGAGTSSPVTGVEGYAFVAGTGLTSNIYLCAGAGQPGNANVHHPSVLLNAGASSFAAPLPSGYSAFNSAGVFDTVDKAPELTLDATQLLVTQSTQITGTNGPTAFVRSTQFRQQA